MNENEFLELHETKDGHDLHIDNRKIALRIKNGIIKNNLTSDQLRFVKNHI